VNKLCRIGKLLYAFIFILALFTFYKDKLWEVINKFSMIKELDEENNKK